MELDSKILILGGTGLVGSALIKRLRNLGYSNVIAPTRKEVDLMDLKNIYRYFYDKGVVDYIFMCAARVGGINANNKYPADFLMDNIVMQSNIISACILYPVKKMMFLGSSCIYPKNIFRPIKEEDLLTSELESTNKAYALAKITGIEMCNAFNKQYGTNYICAMPCNLYGSKKDNYDLQTSHVLPALIRKFHEGKVKNAESVELWGDGSPKREFMHVDDLADTLVYLMNNYNSGPSDYYVNVGVGYDLTIKELAEIVKDIVGFSGNIIWNNDMPNGTMRKLVDISKLKRIMGNDYKKPISLYDGIQDTYKLYLEYVENK